MYEEDRGKAREYKKNRALVQKIAATSTTITELEKIVKKLESYDGYPIMEEVFSMFKPMTHRQ